MRRKESDLQRRSLDVDRRRANDLKDIREEVAGEGNDTAEKGNKGALTLKKVMQMAISKAAGKDAGGSNEKRC